MHTHIHTRILDAIRALFYAIWAEVTLQTELCKKYPFGSNSPMEIDITANSWRYTHSWNRYMRWLKYGITPANYKAIDNNYMCKPRKYSGAYGCFAGPDHLSSNIVCEHGVAYVTARNADEAMDLIYANESKQTMGSDDKYYDDWLLTHLCIIDEDKNRNGFSSTSPGYTTLNGMSCDVARLCA